MKTQSFHNTTNLSGEALKEAIQRAKNQDAAILILYMNWRKPMSPSMVLKAMQKAGKSWPITSVRRSITTLCRRGDLIKTDKLVQGMYSDPEHVWEINAIRYPLTHESKQSSLFNDKKDAA